MFGTGLGGYGSDEDFDGGVDDLEPAATDHKKQREQDLLKHYGPDEVAANFLTDKEHGRFIALAFADNDGSVHVKLVKRFAHSFYSGGIGGFFIPAPDELRSCDGSGFGDAHHFKDEDAIKTAIQQLWSANGDRAASEGTKMHAAIEDFLNGVLPPVALTVAV